MKFKKLRKMVFVTFLSSNMVATLLPMPAMAASAGEARQENDLTEADDAVETESDEEEGLPYYAEFFAEDEEGDAEEDAEAKKAEAKRLYEERQKEEAQMRIEEQLRKEQAHREEGGKSASYVSKKTQEKTVSWRGGSIYDDYPHVMASDSTDTTQRDRYVAYSVSGNDVEIAIDVSDVADMDIFNYGSSNYAFEVYFTDGMKDYYVSAFAATEDVGILNLEQLQGNIMVRTGEYSASGTSCDISVDGGFLVFKGTISEWMTETFDAQNFEVTGYHCNEWIAYSMEHSYMTWSLDDNGKLTIRDAEARTDGMSFIPLYEQCGQVKSIDMDVKNAYGWERLFAGFPNLETATVKADTLSSLSYMFLRCPKLKTVTLRIGDVSQVFSLQAMFKDCKSLTNVDLGTLNTSGAQYFNDMFHGCGSLKTLDLSGLDTSAATEMYGMLAASEMVWDDDLAEYFYHSNLKSIRFGGAFDTSNVRTMSWLFEGCNALESLDLSGFDTSNLERVNSMFHNCKSLQEIDLSNFDLSKVSDDWCASGMFYDTDGLEKIKSPKNLDVSADLPWQKNWCRMDTREQIHELPRNEEISVDIASMLETPSFTYVGYGENRLFLNWRTSEGCSKYRILRREGTSQNWTIIAEIVSEEANASYIDERVVNDREYEYVVVGISEDGSEELTCRSESVSVTPSLDLKAPELKRTVSYYDGIKLYWDCNMGVEKYRVLRKTKGGSWKTLAEVEASSYKDLTAVAGKKYYYTVVGISRIDGRVLTAYNEAGLEAHLRLNQPEYTPLTDANGNVYDLGGMEIIVRDWWSDQEFEADTDYEVERESYLEWAQKTYNFTIKQMMISDWGSAPQDFVDYASQPADDQNYVFTLRQDSLVTSAMRSGLCYDLSTLDCLDFSRPKFQRNLTHEQYSVGQRIYGTYGGDGMTGPDGYAEPRTGVFFNKTLLRNAGIDPESIYDMQRDGTWTWDALVDLLGKVQRDIDGDGAIDVYGANCNKGIFTEACVYSNGGEFIGKLDSGEYEVRIEDEKSLEGLQFAQNVFDTYFEAEPEDASWDYYKTSFQDGRYAFLFEQAWAGQEGMMLTTWYDEYGMPHDTDLDWGFVMFPKGPKADDYVNVWDNNVVCIPANYDAERAWKIAFAWNLYTDETPGCEGNDNWKDYYRQTFDQRAVDETLAMMRQKGTISQVGMVPGIEFGEQFTWNVYPGTGGQLQDIIENAATLWQASVDELNEALGFQAVDKSAPKLLSAEAEYGEAARGIRVTWKPNRGVSHYAIFRKKEGGSWRKIGTADTVRNKAGEYLDATAVLGTTYIYSVRGTDADGNYVTAYDKQGLAATLSAPYTELAITKQPVDWYGTFGKKASFTVEAKGDGLTYDWQFKKKGTWQSYGLTTSDTANFKVTMNTTNIKYPIRCVISDSHGNTVTTNEVWLRDASTVSPIEITKQPVDWEGKLGTKATFSVEATGKNLSYQWQYKKGTKWMPYTVTSATTANLKVTMNEVNVNYPIRCLITDADGNTATTNEVSMRVMAEPVIEGITITSQPTDWYGKYGQKASFNVTATGEGLTYQWQYKKGTTWTDYAIATADTPNFKVTMNEKNVKWAFRCKITDTKGNMEYTDEVCMKLQSEDPIPEGITITSQPCNWYGRYGQKASFNVTATGEGLTYQWQYKKGTTWTDYAIATADTPNFKVTMNEKNVTWAYRCVITDSKGNTVTTNEVYARLSEAE